MSINSLLIAPEEKMALMEIQRNLIADFGVDELVAFGSGVKTETMEGSVLDLLALTEKPVTPQEKQAIKDLVSNVNLTYHTNFTVLIFDKATWEVWSGQTLYQEVKKDGIQIW